MLAFSLSAALLLMTLADSPHAEGHRADAAAALRARQTQLERHADCVHRLPILLESAEAAAGELGDGHFAGELRQAALDARWTAVVDRDAAEERLESALERALDDLEFVPLLEAELPVGFPAPTPVREIELKRYPRYRLARAEMGLTGETGAFWRLFRHIESNEIPMTAPVEMTYGESKGGLRELDMAFLYEHPSQGEAGRDGSVEVLDVEPMIVASLGCRGRNSDAAVEEARAALTAWVASQEELEPAGPLRLLGYNSPMVRGDRRYYEVQLPVRARRAERTVLDFTARGEAERWSSVDDAVMGGVSVSRFARSDEGTSLFVGALSLENNGGFASVRRDARQLDLAGAETLTLTCRGDGRAYQLRLRTSEGMDVPSYQARFETEAGVWTEHRFRLDELRATWRGNPVPGAPALDPAEVVGLGLMIADAQEGAFRLELRALTAR